MSNIKLYLQIGIVFQMFFSYVGQNQNHRIIILLVGLVLVILLSLRDKPA